MSTKTIRLLACAVVLACSGALYAQQERAFIGVQLDPTPLPELLNKHLGLKPNQGIRIQNINVSSPADKTGLERDDIIVGFQGKNVTGVDAFVDAVKQLPVGTKVSLEVIHLGQRKTLEVELAPMSKDPELKYPPEPQAEVTWGPGRVFQLGPNGQNWIEVPFENMPNVGELPQMKRFFSERYFSHHVTDGESFTVTIEGDPKDANTPLIVQPSEKEYRTTVGKIDDLPEKYRAAARESVENAKKSASEKLHIGKWPLPEPPNPDVYRKYFENLMPPRLDSNQWSEQRDRVLEKLQQQMEKMQQRLEQMEKRFDRTAEKSTQKDSGSTSGSEAPKPSGKTQAPPDGAI